METSQLKPGTSYLFDHIRKGPFVAEYTGTSAAREGDPADTFFIDVNIWTEDGSGQERLANTFIRDSSGRKMRPVYEARRLRPSLIRSITSPSAETQRNLLEKFLEIREKGPKDEDGNPTILSLPTKDVLSKLAPAADEKKPGRLKRLFGGKN